MSRTSQILFLVFVWLALVYVIIAFTDITARAFASVMAQTAFGPGVAVSSASTWCWAWPWASSSAGSGPA